MARTRRQFLVATIGAASLLPIAGLMATAAAAEPLSPDFNADILPPGFLARLDLNQPAEVQAILRRIETYFDEHNGVLSDAPPVVMVLHGPEIAMFSRRNYSTYRPSMDLAAKLTALNVIDVRICETRMADEGLRKSDLLPFVGTVPFGPEEVSRLREDEGFVYF